MSETLHDPVPDGRTGPFLREPHATQGPNLGIGDAFDPRCAKCVAEREPTCPACGDPVRVYDFRDSLGRAYQREYCTNPSCELSPTGRFL